MKSEKARPRVIAPRVEPLGPVLRQALDVHAQLTGFTFFHWPQVVGVSYPTLRGLFVGDGAATHRALLAAARLARILNVPTDQVFTAPTQMPLVPIGLTLRDLKTLEEVGANLPCVKAFCDRRLAQLQAEQPTLPTESK